MKRRPQTPSAAPPCGELKTLTELLDPTSETHPGVLAPEGLPVYPVGRTVMSQNGGYHEGGRARAQTPDVVRYTRGQDTDEVTLTPAQRAEQAKYSGQFIYNSIHSNSNGENNRNTVMPPISNVAPPLPPAPLPPGGVDPEQVEGTDEPGKMSSVRRTFCLYALFDLGLMFILWVIYTQLIGKSGYEAFEDQVEHYDFKTSLFDTVMLSAVRVTLLLLTYGLFRSMRCWMVAICTTLTCGVLVAKIFIFDFEGTQSSNNPLSYCLIIISFVLSWSETWFVDFKVLPTERKFINRATTNGRYGRGYGSTFMGTGGRHDDLRSILTEDHTFYSPLDSPEGSDTEDGGRQRQRSPQARPPLVAVGEPLDIADSIGVDKNKAVEENDYIRLARHAIEVLWTYLKSPESDWKVERGESLEEGIVHSKKVKGIGKVFRLRCYIDYSPQKLYDYVVLKPEEQKEWNATVKEVKILQVVDDHTDIIYIVSNELAGGAIQSRDFVSLRTWTIKNGVHVSAGMGVNHPDMPPQKHCVRGENGAGGYVYEPHPEDPEKTMFSWYMNTDIKGWFPKKLIDANMAAVLFDFRRDLIKQIEVVKGSAGEDNSAVPSSNKS